MRKDINEAVAYSADKPVIIGSVEISRTSMHSVYSGNDRTIGEQIDEMLNDGDGPISRVVFEFTTHA